MVNLPFKTSRRLKENIWYQKKLSPKQCNRIKLFVKRNANRKLSDFSMKLLQWKKLAFFYGMPSLTANQTFKNVLRQKDKKKSLLLNLETRLDVLLTRLHFCSTLNKARQLIVHKQVCINFQTVNIPGFIVKNGDTISIKSSMKNQVQSDIQLLKLQDTLSALQTEKQHFQSFFTPPIHVEANYKTLQAILLYEPKQVHFPYKMNLDLLF